MDPLSIGLAGAGFLSNLIGQQQNAKDMRSARNLVNSQIADLTAWRDTGVNQPYLDSNVGRNVITKAFEGFRNNAQNAKSTAAVTGASDESVIAQQDNAGKQLGNVMSDVAVQGTIRADQIENQYRSNLANLLAQKLGIIQGDAQSGANLATSAGSFMQGTAPMLAGVGGNNPTKGLDKFGRTPGQNQGLGKIAGSA
jgi:hypothetical protein